ncbi:hypothetical protein [Enterococcus innesii]|uniref:hypothetical protein n=1 Tax=Enterococcus innesii TaxID=2839759 RepID=UPI002DBD0698|nr:hypothetical protein [Enterococcus innesii]MEB5950223.1 hypothetical protein [Enterococcus innesii]
MKKIVLGSTFIASLLLAGGVNAFAVTDVPDPITIPIELEYGDASFVFNDISLTAPVISESIFEGPVEGAISNVGGTLTNLTASTAIVNFAVNAPDDFDGIVVDATNLNTLTADPVDIESLGTDITFTIDQTFAQAFAALAEDADAPVITVTAQDGTDPGQTPSL